jgi:hypothetical protein
MDGGFIKPVVIESIYTAVQKKFAQTAPLQTALLSTLDRVAGYVVLMTCQIFSIQAP